MKKTEHYKCPEHFQDRLTRIGGINRYGEPNFIIVWGQSWTVRRGGIWSRDDRSYFRGYKDVVEDGRPCWVLKQWKAPEVYGSPTLWFLQNRDEASGLQILGDYPWRGSYDTVQPFIWRGLVNGRMVVESMPLNSMMLNMIVPIIMRCKEATATQKRLAMEAMKDKENRDQLRAVEAARHNAKLAFRGPVSYSRQGCRTPLYDQKVRMIEKNWYKAMNHVKNYGLGISVH